MLDRILSGVRRPASGVLAVLVTAGIAAAERPPVYEVVDLGRLGFIHDPEGRGGGLVPGTFDVNDHDQVAYARAIDDDAGGTVVKPFLFLPEAAYDLPEGSNDLLQAFGGPGGPSVGAAFDVNNDGVVVGQIGGAGFFEGDAYAWILDPSDASLTQLVALPTPAPGPGEPAYTWSRAVSISETAPWTILVHTGRSAPCPSACDGGPPEQQDHLRSYVVTLAADGTTGPAVLLAGDLDCEAAVGAWGVSADGTVQVGSDLRVTEKACTNQLPGLCAEDQSGLRWSGVLRDLDDFDPPGSIDDLLGSHAQDVGLDGLAVGYGEVLEGGVCESRALLWDPTGAIDTNLHGVSIDTSFYEPGPQPIGFISETTSAAVGRNDAPARTIVGWDSASNRGVLWYETAPGSNAWRVMFPGVGSILYSPGSVIEGSCVSPGGQDAEVRYLYDVNDRQVVVGRVQFLQSDPEFDQHLVLLIPRDGCTQADTDQDGDVDFDDLLAVIDAFNDVCENCQLCPSDVDGSRVVDFQDLVEVLSSWTPDCVTFSGPPQTVQDCWERSGGNLAAFEACVETLAGQ